MPAATQDVDAPTVLSGPTVAEWSVWTTTARVVVTDASALDDARRIVTRRLARIDQAANRFSPDSEVRRHPAAGPHPVPISTDLADLVRVALDAARRSGGDVDPTLGAALVALGYAGDLPRDAGESSRAAAPARLHASRSALQARHSVTWRDVELDDTDPRHPMLRLPAGVLLDLGATAKARAADLCATDVAAQLGCGVLVSIGGDLRVAGPRPATGWDVLVQDGPGEPGCVIALAGAEAVATSSTLHRVWSHRGVRRHHILDPLSGVPVPPVWRTVTVAADTCVEANVLTTSAMVRGVHAPAMLERVGVAARLVAQDGAVLTLGGWPR